METPPNRFSPNNSPEMRALRMAQHIKVLAKIVETPEYRYILGEHNQIIDVHLKPDVQP